MKSNNFICHSCSEADNGLAVQAYACLDLISASSTARIVSQTFSRAIYGGEILMYVRFLLR